jgi:hypothetical protein
MRFFIAIFLFFLPLHAGTVVEKVSIEAKETQKGVAVFFGFHTRYDSSEQNDSIKNYGKSESFCTLVDYTDNKILSSGSIKTRSLYSNYFDKPLLLPLSAKQKKQLKGVKVACTTQLGSKQFFSFYKLPILKSQIRPLEKIEPTVKKENASKQNTTQKKASTNTPKKITSAITLGKLKILNVTKISHRNNNPNEFLIEGSNGNYVLKKEDLKKAVFHNISKKSLQKLEKKAGIKLKVSNKQGAKEIRISL